MSRLWDTPEYWARSEADEMLREVEDRDVAAVADAFERTSANYDGDPDFAAAILAELRLRATAGVRFWSNPQVLAPESSAPARDDIGALIDGQIPW